MSSGRCGLCGNKFGQRAEELVHSDCVDEMNRKVDRLRERLDQFEAYGMPNVAAALDRIAAAELERDALLRERGEEWTFQFVEEMKAKCNSCTLVESLERKLDDARATAERCADLDGATVQEIAEKTGLWHQVEQHADGAECEWCGNDGACGELTGAGLAALGERAASSRAGAPATDAVVEAAKRLREATSEPWKATYGVCAHPQCRCTQEAAVNLLAALAARRRG